FLLLSGVTIALLCGGDALAQNKPKPREPGSEPGTPDQGVRDTLTGNYPEHSTAEPKESDELKAMRELDREIFPPQPAPKNVPWSTSIQVPAPGPDVSTSGL